MSTIVGVVKNGEVCLAADTMTKMGYMRQSVGYLENMSKLLQLGENWFGIAGSADMKTILEGYFSKKSRLGKLSNEQEIFETFRRFHKVLKEEYYLNPTEKEPGDFETSRLYLLLANPYGLFGIYEMRGVDKLTKFWATGSGRDFACGAMFTVYDRYKTAKEICRAGLEAAADFDDGSSAPFDFQIIKLKKKK